VDLEKLSGLQTKILRRAIGSAFVNTGSLNVFLKEELDKPALDDFTAGDNREERIFSLIQVAEAEGWLTDLIAKLQAFRPNNSLVRNLPDALRLGNATQNAVAPHDQMSLEKLVRNSGFADLRLWAERMSEIGQATCRIEVQLEQGITYGTGFLVTDDLVLTNYHVVEDHIRDQKESTSIGCRFDYAMDVQGLDQGKVIPLVSGPTWLAASSPYDSADTTGNGVPAADHLDFALLRLSVPAGQQDIGNGLRRGKIPLPSKPATPAVDAPVFIVQHPLGQPMALAIGKVLGLDQSGGRLRYNADTEGGSSGSGVFDERLQLVALHHAGDPAAKIRAAYNQGIPIGRIAAMLVENKIDLSVRAPVPKPPPTPRDLPPGKEKELESVSSENPAKRPDPPAVIPAPETRPPWRTSAVVIAILVFGAAVASIIWYFAFNRTTPGQPSPAWVEVPNAEIHKNVAVRTAPSDTASVLRELNPGDIGDFGNSPSVRKTTVDRKRWYELSLRNINTVDNKAYFSEDDAPGALVEWRKIEGCLRTKQPQTSVFTAALKEPLDFYPLGVSLPLTQLQTATVGDGIWFRYRNDSSSFRYVPTNQVEKLNSENCPTGFIAR
jgi:hypothetical protein